MHGSDINSVCTYCGTGCDITAQVEDNKIVKIYAQNDGYVSQGKLCTKGAQGFSFVDSKERIRNARVRKSFIEKNMEGRLEVENKPEGARFLIQFNPQSIRLLAKLQEV